ncbi:MAG TPA: hypothetical protein VFC19_40880 [Candidatus Limnocylindrales bacterium]|nr:hypothetical protein [Candidatus Limnocylindrales bacterium]
MRWVDGTRLDDWIDDHLHEPDAIRSVRINVSEAVAALRRHGAAHGDLQHGNVLVRSDRSIRLVDYDGMYLPTLSRYGAAEQGHRNYQHAERSAQYDESLDLFAAAVIDLSLAAAAHDPKLWKEFNRNRASGESLLFTAADFADPAASPVFAQLARIPRLVRDAGRLRHACEASFEAIPMALTGKPVPASAQRRSQAASAPPTIFRATDRATLLARQGDEVTVVGAIVATKTTSGLRGMITMLNFGDYRNGDFTAVAFRKASKDLEQVFGDPRRLVGRWVAITGLVTVFQRSKSAPQTPQIELRRARMLRALTPTEAAVLLAGPAGSSSKPTPAPDASNFDDRLGKLYSSPSLIAKIAPQSMPPSAPPITSQSSTASKTPSPPASKPVAQTPPPPRMRAPRHKPTGPHSTLSPPATNPPIWSATPPHSAPPSTTPYAATPYTAVPYAKPAYTGPGGNTGLGVAALAAGLCFPPVGVALGIAALLRGNRQSQVDRICAWIGLGVGVFGILACGCSMFSMFDSATPQ